MEHFFYNVFKEGILLKVTDNPDFYYNAVRGQVGEVINFTYGCGVIPMSFMLRFKECVDPFSTYRTLDVAGPFGSFGRFNMSLLSQNSRGAGYTELPPLSMEFYYEEEEDQKQRKRKREDVCAN
jgi:hypothetical protein